MKEVKWHQVEQTGTEGHIIFVNILKNYEHLNCCIFITSDIPLYIIKEWVLFYRGCHVALQCSHNSPEWTNSSGEIIFFLGSRNVSYRRVLGMREACYPHGYDSFLSHSLTHCWSIIMRDVRKC